MKELILVIVGAALVNNIILSQFQGLCPFLGVSKKTETAAGMGAAVIFVITLASFVASVIYKFVLTPTGGNRCDFGCHNCPSGRGTGHVFD